MDAQQQQILVVGDSRLAKVKNYDLGLPDGVRVTYNCKPGASLYTLLSLGLRELRLIPYTLVVVLGGFCDLSNFVYDHNGRKVALEHTWEATDAANVVRMIMDRYCNKYARRFPNCKLLIGNIPHADLMAYSRVKFGPNHETTQDTMTIVNNAIQTYNQEIMVRNARQFSGYEQKPMIPWNRDTLITRLQSRGRNRATVRRTRSFKFTRLYDGVHPDDRLAEKWGRELATGIRTALNIPSPSA